MRTHAPACVCVLGGGGGRARDGYGAGPPAHCGSLMRLLALRYGGAEGPGAAGLAWDAPAAEVAAEAARLQADLDAAWRGRVGLSEVEQRACAACAACPPVSPPASG